MSNMFECTCPNHSGVGAIDKPDRFEQAFDTYYLTEVSEKFFMDGISMDHPQKMYNFCVLKAFISNFTYYKCYKRKLKVITRKKYGLPFSIQALHFFLETLGFCELKQFELHDLNLQMSAEKNVEVVWENEGHTSSAQLPQVSFSNAYSK